jgi:hypothetical protein
VDAPDVAVTAVVVAAVLGPERGHGLGVALAEGLDEGGDILLNGGDVLGVALGAIRRRYDGCPNEERRGHGKESEPAQLHGLILSAKNA